MTTPAPQPPGPASGHRPRPAIVQGVAVAAIVVATALVVPTVAGTEATRGETPAATSADGPTHHEIVVVDDLTTRHLTEPVDYAQSPPVGGDHAPAWLECGTYDEPVPDENAVHSLEHGTVWVTYRPGLDEARIEALAAALPAESIVSPYDDLPAPVVVSVWGAQLALTGPDDPRLALFLAEYADGHTSPEPLASCAGGVTGDDTSTVSV